ncbi:MAG: hypothetical protein ACEPOW_13880 [Bacteroidales bacterium]
MEKAVKQDIFLKYALEFGCVIKTADHFQLPVKKIEDIIKHERNDVRHEAYKVCWRMFQDYKNNKLNLKTFAEKYTMSDEEAHHVIELGRVLDKNNLFTK